ncbi:hypothetical protein RB653_009441 [Dictyostelium firmibasis]|uniref:C2 domain-containing protein n=1 Tax=Dictyostelium firmibasis TaxID=79012 RepID=A0AAN7Z0N0_9MYCE
MSSLKLQVNRPLTPTPTPAPTPAPKVSLKKSCYLGRSGPYHDELPPGRTRAEVEEAKKSGICLEDITIFKIKISRGIINKPTDLNGLSDGYCKIFKSYRDEFGDQIRIKLFKTQVCKKTLTPEWNYEGIFSIFESCQNLRLELWDKDLIKNNYIGCKSIYHKDIEMGEPLETDLQLSYKKKTEKIVGSVVISVEKLEVNEENKQKCQNGINVYDRLHIKPRKIKVPSNFQNE